MAKTDIQKTPVFLLQNPATNAWRSNCFLGVAFANGYQGLDGEWAPQGLPEQTVQAVPGGAGNETATAHPTENVSQDGNWLASTLAQVTGYFTQDSSTANQDGNPVGSLGVSTSDPVPTPVPTNNGVITKWPKDIVPEIYSEDSLVEAVDAETVLEKTTDIHINAWMKNLMKGKFHWSSTDKNTSTIPVFKRITMQRPVTKIRLLLHDPVYKAEMFKLFGELGKGDKKRLWVATQIIVCGNMSKETLQKSALDVGAEGADPTDTVPIKVAGELKWVKSATLKGTYKNEMIVGMVYRTIRYTDLQEEGTHVPFRKKEPKWDVVVEENKSGFHISRTDAKGQAAPFLGGEELDDSDKCDKWAFDDLFFCVDEGKSDSEGDEGDYDYDTENDTEEASEDEGGGNN